MDCFYLYNLYNSITLNIKNLKNGFDNLLKLYLIMKKKIIWVDLDEVLAETLDRCLEYNNYMIGNLKISKDNVRDYYLHKKYEINLEDSVEWF